MPWETYGVNASGNMSHIFDEATPEKSSPSAAV